jgi:peptidoglycan hydrolase-like protein with peptidoglycan-binding domain
VQIVALSARKWQKHGKLPYVVYGGEVKGTVTVELSVLRKGSRGEEVKTLQRLLNAFGSSLDVDGDFGSKTDKALREYQKAKGLEVDGICGKNSWTSLLK